MSEPTPEALLRLVVGVATADGELTPRERVFLARFAERRGLGREAVAAALEAPAAGGPAAVPSLASAEERRRLLDLLVDAACADQEVAPEEAALLERVGRALGFAAEDVRATTARRLEAVVAGAARRAAATAPPAAASPPLLSCRVSLLAAAGCLLGFVVAAAVVARWAWTTWRDL